MSIWDTYPADYRKEEVRAITQAVTAGECVSVVGLSGAGKSNLMGFLAHRCSPVNGCGSEKPCRLVLVDGNGLSGQSREALFALIQQAIHPHNSRPDNQNSVDAAVSAILQETRLCLLLDRFDALNLAEERSIPGRLRALRDAFKYDLTYVTATRRPLESDDELGELFYANTIWLGPLRDSDARWNIEQYASRKGLAWEERTAATLLELSGGYPAFLKSVCEAHSAGAGLTVADMLRHPAVQRRLDEFWADEPGEEDLRRSGLKSNPLLTEERYMAGSKPEGVTNELTAKEHLLLEYFRQNPSRVCEKDDLIRAAWPEDKVFIEGIRDDSLAQLVRRLRKKIEPDPAKPRHIHTVAGRGYRYTP